MRYAFLTLLWVGVVAYVVYAATSAKRVRSAKQVQRVVIDVVDSTSQGHLVSAKRVRQWIAASDIRTVGESVDRVRLNDLEKLIARNGFVERVVASVDYRGDLSIAIRQRKPLLRLLVDGMNLYATADGYVFAAPRASALYVPVVTGSYQPPFPASYSGGVRAHIDERKLEIEARIAELERDKYPFYKREMTNDRRIRDLRREVVKKQWWRFESSESYELRIKQKREEKAAKRRAYRYEARQIQAAIDRICERQEAERLRQKKLEKNYEDFMKLLTFVNDVESDDFWRSEVVQISARTTVSGALELELTPRSGSCIIRFGRIEEVDEKFDKLLQFYRSGLSSIGWNEYKVIDIRYKDQVVCKK